MFRRIILIPTSAACFAASYAAYQLGKAAPGSGGDKLQFASFCLGSAGATTAWFGLKPGKKKSCRACGNKV